MDAAEAAKQAIFLTQTGADLAATLGGSTEEAVSALGGALRGEYDPLERFGIALTANQVNAKAVAMGLADSESSVDAYGKQQATLALLTERSAFAQGTFAKEAGTAEGAAKIAGAQLQNTSADIGKSFLPIYTKAAEVIGALAKAFGALPDSVQTGVLLLGGAAIVGTKIFDGMKSAATAIKSVPDALDKMVDKLTSSKGMLEGFGTTAEMSGGKSKAASGLGGIGALGPAMLGVGAAVGIAAIFWQDYNQKQEDAKNRAKELGDTLDESTGAFTSQTDAMLFNILETKNQVDNLNKAKISFDSFRDAIADSSGKMKVLNDVEKNYINTLGVAANSSAKERTIQKLREEGGARNELIAKLAEQDALDYGLFETIMQQSEAVDKNLELTRKRAENAAYAAGKDEEQAIAAGKAAAANQKNAEAIKEIYDNTLALLNSNIGFQQAQVASQKAIEEYNKSLGDGSLSALDRREKELSLMSQFSNTAAAAVKAAEDQAKLEGKTLSAGEAAIIQRDKLKELAGQVDPNSPVQYGLQLMISQLQGVIDRRNVDIRVSASGLNETQIALRNFLGIDTLTGLRGKGLGILVSIPEPGAKPRAVGGPVNANSPYLVGERGPELFVPTGYGKIIDNMATMATLTGGTPVAGGGGMNVTINLPPGVNGDDVVDAIRRYERRNGPIFQSA